MKLSWIAVGIASVLIVSVSAEGEPACQATVQAQVSVSGEELSLADLLVPGTCPRLLRAAARVRLGSVPRWGSLRVFQADEVRRLFEKLEASSPSLPERITVRRAGARSSCNDVGAQVLAGARPSARSEEPRETECGAAGRIPQNTPLEVARAKWNPAIGSWEVTARCLRFADCVPFWVRLPGLDSLAAISHARFPDGRGIVPPAVASKPPLGPAAPGSAGMTVVHSGEAVTLLWNQDGIRLVVRAISLDSGMAGQTVRARIARGGRIVPAVVESAGVLRAAF